MESGNIPQIIVVIAFSHSVCKYWKFKPLKQLFRTIKNRVVANMLKFDPSNQLSSENTVLFCCRGTGESSPTIYKSVQLLSIDCDVIYMGLQIFTAICPWKFRSISYVVRSFKSFIKWNTCCRLFLGKADCHWPMGCLSKAGVLNSKADPARKSFSWIFQQVGDYYYNMPFFRSNYYFWSLLWHSWNII